MDSALLQFWFSDKALGLSPWQPAPLTSVQPFLPLALSEQHILCLSLSGSLCAAGLGTQEAAASLNVPSPKGRNVLCRIWQEFGRTESLLSAETRSDQPPVPAEGKHKCGNRPNTEGNNFVLLHFLFLEGLSCLCTLSGIGDLLLRAGFLQPGSLHSHFILFSCAVAGHLGRAVPLCMQGYSFPLGRKSALLPSAPARDSELSTGRGFLPFSALPGAGTSSQALIPAARMGIGVGWGGANYPVLTRERLRLCTLMRSRLPRWVISLETRWVLTQGNELVPGGSGCALAQPCLQQQSPRNKGAKLETLLEPGLNSSSCLSAEG